MARRFTRDLRTDEGKPATSEPVSLAGLIKLQPNRKKGNKTWRPMRLSDFGTNETSNDFGDSDHNESDSLSSSLSKTQAMDSPSRMASRAFPYDLSKLETDLSPILRRQNMSSQFQRPDDASSAIAEGHSGDISLTVTRYGSAREYSHLFGELPDPIRLTEQVGTFDGQVIFIAHPNRDVTAHQWTSQTFQWVNIGTYSHTRGKIEGSLASDRLRGAAILHNTIKYFKAVAEQRELHVRENGRQDEQQLPSPTSVRRIDPLCRSVVTEPDRYASHIVPSGSAVTQLPPLPFPQVSLKGGTQGAATPPVRTVIRDYLDDPFVTPGKVPRPAVPNAFTFNDRSRGDIPRANPVMSGSMDFKYEFPSRLDTARVAASGQLTRAQIDLFRERERNRLHALRGGHAPASDPAVTLRDIEFGEDASSIYAASAKRITAARLQNPSSPEDMHNRRKLGERLGEIEDQAHRPGSSHETRVAIPTFQSSQALPRAIPRPPGLTVANPTRTSNLNANAAPYTYTSVSSLAQSQYESDSEDTAVNTGPIANLKFSDPDGMRVSERREVAIGLGQQAPTQQTFTGPFFVDSMPTSYDPAASLSLQVNERDKLINWFRDGQRPARQQDFAKRIIAATISDTTSRGPQSFGMIGSGKPPPKDPSAYMTTAAFVRLYENLLGYRHESQHGGESHYFTRAWQSAHPRLIDPAPGANDSFFGPDSGLTAERDCALEPEPKLTIPTWNASSYRLHPLAGSSANCKP